MNHSLRAAFLIATLVLFKPALRAQTENAPAHGLPPQPPVKVIHLNNTARTEDANEILIALRDVVAPTDKMFFVESQNAIVISGARDQLEFAENLVKELDRPKKMYRLTFTVAESDGGKRIGVQHFDMVVASGQRTTLKQGSKVPVVTGNYTAGNNSAQNQFTYLDVGLNFDASLDESANGVRLRCKVERSSVAESSMGPNDPVIRQTVLEGTSSLSLGKPLVLGSLDVPDSTRHLDVEVVMDIVR